MLSERGLLVTAPPAAPPLPVLLASALFLFTDRFDRYFPLCAPNDDDVLVLRILCLLRSCSGDCIALLQRNQSGYLRVNG
jgi:hypothetical protein